MYRRIDDAYSIIFIQHTGNQFKMTNDQFKKPTSSESSNDVAGSHLASSTGRGGACARECGAGCRAGAAQTARRRPQRCSAGIPPLEVTRVFHVR